MSYAARSALSSATGSSSLAPTCPDPTELVGRALAALVAAADALALEPQRAELQAARLMTPTEALLHLLQGRTATAQEQLCVPVADGRIVVVRAAEEVIARLRALAPRLSRAVEIVRGAEWIVFMPGLPRTSGVDVGERDSRRLLQHLQRCGIEGWCAGISPLINTPDDMPAAYRDAADAACLGDPKGSNEVLVDEDWARLTVARLRAVAQAALPLRSPLDVLAEYDRTQKTNLYASLTAWLDANADMKAAAEAIGVHVNTLRYRVRRAADVAGLDLDDPQQRLVLLLAGRPA